MAEFNEGDSTEIEYTPLLEDLEPRPHSLLWIDVRLHEPEVDSEKKLQLEGQRTILETSQKDAWSHLEDFRVPMTREELLRYADIAGKTGDHLLINRLDARIVYDLPQLIPDTREDMQPFYKAVANTFRHRAIDLRDKSKVAKSEGNEVEAAELMRQAKGAYDWYGTHASFAGEAYYRDEHSTLSMPKEQISTAMREAKVVDLFFEPGVSTVWEELYEGDLRFRIANGEVDIPGVDRGWLAVFNRSTITPEGEHAMNMLKQYLAQKQGIRVEDLNRYEAYKLEEFFGNMSEPEHQ